MAKSCHRLGEIGVQGPWTVRALVHASFVVSIMISLPALKHRLEEGHEPHILPLRTKPPIHPQVLGKMLGQAAMTITLAYKQTGRKAEAEWKRLAMLISLQGTAQ